MYKITVPIMVTTGRPIEKEKILDEIKRFGGQRVALAMARELGHSFTSNKYLNLLKELIPYFRSNGMETIVWLGETFGHDGGKPLGDQPYTNIRFVPNGDIKAFCPLDERFKKDFSDWIYKIALCGADMIMLDDDFRLGIRGDGIGCCCDLHLAELEKELGEKITVDELHKKVFSGSKNRYRDAWRKVQSDSMKSFAIELRKAADKVSEDIRIGFCCNLDWESGCDVIETAKLMAGKTKPFLRLSGAPYWVRWGHPLGRIVEFERAQCEWCRNEEIEIFTEGDTFPRPRTATPAAYLESFDTMLRASGETNGILKYGIDYFYSTDYETGYADAAEYNKNLYSQIDSIMDNKKCVGVKPYSVMNLFEEACYPECSQKTLLDCQQSIYRACSQVAVMNNLPTAYNGNGVNLLFGENARYITENELKNGNIIDIEAAKILIDRGFDVGIAEIKGIANPEGFGRAPFEYYKTEDRNIMLSTGPQVIDFILNEKAEVLTEFLFGQIRFNGVYRYENKEGLKFLVFPFDMEKTVNISGWMNSYSRRRLLISQIDKLGEALVAYADGNYLYLYTMVKKGDNKVSVGLWNIYPDAITNAKIKISVPFSDVKFVNCNGHKEGDSIILDTKLYPYEFAGFELLNY